MTFFIRTNHRVSTRHCWTTALVLDSLWRWPIRLDLAGLALVAGSLQSGRQSTDGTSAAQECGWKMAAYVQQTAIPLAQKQWRHGFGPNVSGIQIVGIYAAEGTGTSSSPTEVSTDALHCRELFLFRF